MPISVNENGVVKPLGSNILYERQIRYIPWHTTYQALTGHDCVAGNVDLFCTVNLSFTPDYVLVKKPVKNAIFFQNDSHIDSQSMNNWYCAGDDSYNSGFYHFVVLTPVHSRHNMSETEKDSTLSLIYDVSNVPAAGSSKWAHVYTGFELVDSMVKCYFSIPSAMRTTASWVTQGVGFGYDASNNTTGQTRVLELDIEAFGNCQPTAI